MTRQLGPFDYIEVAFDEGGRLLRPPSPPAATDLVVLVHGWNNTRLAAQATYTEIAQSLAHMLAHGDGHLVTGRRIMLAGVFWPSNKWEWFERLPGSIGLLDAPAGAELALRLDTLHGTATSEGTRVTLAKARALVPQLDRSVQAQHEFADLLRDVLGTTPDEDCPDDLFTIQAPELVSRLSARVLSADGAQRNLIGGFLEGAKRLVDFVAYYEMKARAGTIGERGLAAFLRNQVPAGVRVHLVGHSFGGRMISAACSAPGGLGGRPCSMTVLQGALSHYGYARAFEPGRDGPFRSAITSGVVTGPLLVTHTRNDTLVSLAYGVASQLANQISDGPFGPDSRFGGLGANGAQSTPEAVRGSLAAAHERYEFRPRSVHNLLADAHIRDHSDITGREVAHAILSAIAATP
ncbi:hypothetical protein ACIBEJ_33295 [Nonomuraea sp. NPDC050790]|uniref:hypothetical protein n=1 Tax=Nonomuraea sp. NPDC050790 TaxID=3364371 RepID=UPI0037A53842